MWITEEATQNPNLFVYLKSDFVIQPFDNTTKRINKINDDKGALFFQSLAALIQHGLLFIRITCKIK